MKKLLLLTGSMVFSYFIGQAQLQFIDSGQNLPSAQNYCSDNGDIDNDGDIDVVSLGYNSQGYVFNNDGTGNFIQSGNFPPGLHTGVELAHLDGDNFLDLIVVREGSSSVLYKNNGGGGFMPYQSIAPGTKSCAADLDGDGDIDFLLVNKVSQTDLIYMNDGLGNFSATQSFGSNTEGSGCAIGDIDGDGDNDFLRRYLSSTEIYTNDGTGFFTLFGSVTRGNPVLADFDGDSDLDLIVTSGHTYMFLNDGSGNFSSNQVIIGKPGNLSSHVVLEDIDLDGDVDLFVPLANSSPHEVWLNDGSANFAFDVSFGAGFPSLAPNLGDFDGDGLVDIYLATSAGVDKVFFQFMPGALDFEVSSPDQYVQVGTSLSSQFTNTDQITVESWINLESAAGQRTICGNYDGTSAQFFMRIDGTKLVFFVSNAATGGWVQATSSANVSVGTWTHVAGTYDGSNIKVYINGVLEGTTSFSGDMVATTDFKIGRNHPNSSENFDGLIDDLRIWSCAKSASAISADMNALHTGLENGLVAYYDFSDGSGTTLTDLTGNGFDGTLMTGGNEPTWVTGQSLSVAPSFSGCALPCSVTDQILFEADWSDCPGIDSLITLNGSEVGFNYYLRDDANNIVIDGPIVGTGSAINLSTGAINSSTTFNVIASQSTIPPGSGGMLFDGTDDHIDLAIDCNENEYTAEVWIKTTNPNCGIMHQDGATGGFGGGHDRHLYLSGGDLYARLWMNETISTSGTNFADGNWHHIAYTFGGGNGAQKIYVDGILEATGTLTSSSFNGSSINLGYSSDVGTYFQGEMDEFRIWTVSRSQAEIQADMNTCLTGTESGLQVLYQFDNGSGSVVTDLAGNDHMGDMFNTGSSAWTTNGVNCGSTICAMEMTDKLMVTIGDTQNPTATNPAPINVECFGDIPTPDPTVITDEADNCGVPSVSFISDVSDGNACPEVITRTYRVDDGNGNTIDLTQTITVNDATPPTASNPVAVNVECFGDIPAIDPTVVTDETDNCGTPTVAHVSDVSDGNSCPEVITRTYSVTDDCGNSINLTQTITINDITLPTASNPIDINVECIGDVPVADPTVVTDEADNCGTPTVAFVSDVSDGNTCPETIIRTYSVTDDCGNSINVNQTIIVNDITSPTASNPADINVQCNGFIPAADPSVVTDEFDNCGTPNVAFVSDVSDGNTCPETITRTYSVTDDCGNSINVVQLIIVDDTVPPSISGCPSNLNLSADQAGCEAIANWGAVFVSDNCSGSPFFSESHVSGTSFPLGTTSVNFTAVDDCGNVATCDFDVTVTNDLVVALDSVWNAMCADSTDGQAFVTTTLGSAPYTYDWDHDGTGDNDDSEDQDGLADGTYNLTVTDAAGCTASTSATITEPTALTVTVDATMNPTSCGVADGSILITAAGGTGAIAYDWDNDGTGDFDDVEDLSSLLAGAYVVEVMDDNGCLATTSATLSDPAGPIITITGTTDNLCFEDSLGTIDATIIGGLMPYTIDWDNDGTGDNDDTEDISNLWTATFNITVTDANGCVGSGSATIAEPSAITTTPTLTDVLCNADSTGTATLNPSGGTGALIEDWGTANPAVLWAGFHTYTITDANNCTLTDSVEIMEPAALSYTDSTLIISCNGEVDGEMYITPMGGTAAYLVIWSADTASSQTGLGAGFYTFTIEDANMCTLADSIEIIEPAALALSTVVTSELFGTDGTIDLTVTGGTMPYTYDWDNDGIGDNDDTEDLSGLTSGTYTVVVTDSNGCMDSTSVTVDSELGLEDESFAFTVYPNPTTGNFMIDLKDDMNGGLLKVFDSSGKLVISQEVQSLDNRIFDISNYSDGFFIIHFVSNNGIISTSRIVKQ